MRPLDPGEGVTALDDIRTGSGVVAAFVMAGGGSLRVNEHTRLRIDSPTVVVLESGTVYADTGLRRSDQPLEIRTPLGAVRDIGTRFEVRVLGARVRVRVREGEVVLARGTSATRAGKGTEIAADADSVTTSIVPVFGADWAWLGRVADTFDLKGRSLAEFLEWVARETGLAVSFESEALAARAKTMTLHGSIEGLTPEEALDVVLPATGLDHQVSDGRVLVRAQ
jgi:ferric-dicitrate binding protein FerR (iron transport regulator)